MISGAIGPRGDGYQVGAAMTVDEARAYHAVQLRCFAESAVDLVTAVTMTYAQEAVGLALAARDAGLPVVISFTVETDGRVALRSVARRGDRRRRRGDRRLPARTSW